MRIGNKNIKILICFDSLYNKMGRLHLLNFID